MAIQQMHQVGVVVNDLEAATAFFIDLGMELEGEAPIEGAWVDRVNGLDGVRVDIAMLRTPDGEGRLELTRFRTPTANSSERWLGTKTATGSATPAAPRASSSRWPRRSAEPTHHLLERTATMAVAGDLDRATDSQWDWVAEQTRTYLASGGTAGHESDGVHTLVLATTGRTSGEPRRTCLIYGTSGDDFVVVASNGGADQDPDWFKNLQANPSVGVQVGTRRFTGQARVASPAERETLWPQMARIFPLYDEYAQQTDRVIPIVLLIPQD